MTTSYNDTLAYLDTAFPTVSDTPEEARSRRRNNPLLVKQKRSLGRYVVDSHIHRSFEQLLICERGSGSILLEDGRHTFQAPAVLVVPSLTVHALSFDENSERWVVSIAKGYFQELAARAPEFSEIFSRGLCLRYAAHDRACVELQHVLDKLDWEQRRSASCRDIVIEALLIDVLVGVLRRIQDSRAPDIDETASDQDVHRSFTRLVEEHHAENWSLQLFADALRVSVPRLRTACRNVSGESPIRIINTRILLEAKRCLTHTNLSVAEIACRLGFEDASYFSRFFKSRTGQTPTVYKTSKSGLRRIFQQGRPVDELLARSKTLSPNGSARCPVRSLEKPPRAVDPDPPSTQSHRYAGVLTLRKRPR
jgi:AraC family transcriptional activator of pobA